MIGGNIILLFAPLRLSVKVHVSRLRAEYEGKVWDSWLDLKAICYNKTMGRRSILMWVVSGIAKCTMKRASIPEEGVSIRLIFLLVIVCQKQF
jgi:hypothetical protein